MQNLVIRTKRFLRVLQGADFYPSLDKRLPTERYGARFAGWDVYPQGISTNSLVYSFGVGMDVSFERAMIERFAVGIHAFDPTPKSIAWVKQQELPDAFVMHGYGIADVDAMLGFHPPENPDHVSHTLLERPQTAAAAIDVPVKRLQTIMEELGHKRLDLLKMDIEGAEYAVIEDLAKGDIRPEHILVEFHHRFPQLGIAHTKRAIETLRYMGYSLYAVAITGEEYSFIRTPQRAM